MITTAEEFKTMIQKSESSPKMSFEQYQKKMNKWLTKNI
jgi:hypothetical protein